MVGQGPIASAKGYDYPAAMNPLLLIIVLILLFGGGGIGLILLICLVIYLLGGWRPRR